jgi:hypothetical protein
MKLSFGLVHEGDLMRFIQVLAAQRAGIFIVTGCALDRTGRNDSPAPRQANLSAQCDLSWLTVDPGRASRDAGSANSSGPCRDAAVVGNACRGAFGTVVFTPSQRAALDAGKQVSKPRTARAVAPRGPRAVTLNGVVTRSDGGTAVWINGRAADGRVFPGKSFGLRDRPDVGPA